MDSIQESGAQWDAALEQQLCFEIKTFLLAGHETSAGMLTWAIYELSQAPQMQQKVRGSVAACRPPAALPLGPPLRRRSVARRPTPCNVSATQLCAQVAAEADAVFKGLGPGVVPPRRDVDNMIYTLSVLKECLRKYR